jgi:hypothetical protein
MRLLIVVLLLAAFAVPAGALQSTLDELSRDKDPFVRSLLWPGLGQIEQGRAAVGTVFAGSAALASFGVFLGHLNYHSAAKDFTNAGDAYADAIDAEDTDTAWYYFQQLDGLSEAADERYDNRKLWFMGLGTVWVANLVDVWWHERGGNDSVAILPVAQVGGGGLAVTLFF